MQKYIHEFELKPADKETGKTILVLWKDGVMAGCPYRSPMMQQRTNPITQRMETMVMQPPCSTNCPLCNIIEDETVTESGMVDVILSCGSGSSLKAKLNTSEPEKTQKSNNIIQI